jgi:hypothetical protein
MYWPPVTAFPLHSLPLFLAHSVGVFQTSDKNTSTERLKSARNKRQTVGVPGHVQNWGGNGQCCLKCLRHLPWTRLEHGLDPVLRGSFV